jgi:hypothetical protein
MAVVSEVLGNTPTVSKQSYVHPAVVGAFDDGTLPELWDAGPRRDGYGLSADERRLLHVLDERAGSSDHPPGPISEAEAARAVTRSRTRRAPTAGRRPATRPRSTR